MITYVLGLLHSASLVETEEDSHEVTPSFRRGTDVIFSKACSDTAMLSHVRMQSSRGFGDHQDRSGVHESRTEIPAEALDFG